MQHTVAFTQLNAKRKYTGYTLVHNIHSGAQHIHDTETFRLPECQVMILVLICLAGTLTSQC